MTIYRYYWEETHSCVIHPLTSWHTTKEGAYADLLKGHPEATDPDEWEMNLEQATLIQD
jgi:hypothetical protein